MVDAPVRSILVVEDDGIIALDISTSLERLGYAVPRTAQSADEAVASVEAAQPDLVLMDIRLRGPSDGIDAARRIKDRWDIPIIYLTSHSDEATLARAKETAPHGYLLKPFQERDLRTAIEVGIRKHELEMHIARRERWFATTLQSIGDAVIATDPDEIVTFMNGVAETLTGWGRDEAIGRSVLEVFRVVDEAGHKIDGPVGRALRNRFAVEIPLDSKLIVRGGGRIDVDDSTAPILDDRGAVLGGVVVFRDVTERRELARRLAHAERLASIGTLAAGVAHEINNPLAVIVANVEFAADRLRAIRARLKLLPGGADLASELDEPVLALEETSEAADRARRIVLDLKKLARADVPECRPVDLPNMIDAALRMTDNKVRHAADLQVTYGTTPLVEVDEGRIVQVFVNLIINAIQAIGHGGAKPNEVRISTRTDDAGRAVTEVRDTGVGMSKKDLARAFDPFFTTKPVGQGAGLGLAICHGIVSAAGGEIAIASELGEGTTVSVVFPPARTPQLSAEAEDEPLRLRARVLLIDDDSNVLRALQRMLGGIHAVVAVSDPRRALSLVANGEIFDVIVCDLMMPEMTGVDMYHALDSVNPALSARVVFMSGGSFTAEVDRFVASFAGLIVGKPCARGDLLSAIENVMRAAASPATTVSTSTKG